MELGSWSLIQSPSLLALIPLAVYIIMVFRGKDNTSGIIVGIAIGALMMGQNLKMLASAFAASLGSSTALIGVIIMTGAGLGVLMTEARVTHTLVYWIVKRIGVNTQTKAKITLIICSILVCGLLGTLGGGNAVIAPILIPLMAALGVTPTVVAALFKVSGEVGLMVGPLTGVTLITMEVTGLSYGQLMVGAVIPFAVFWLGGMWFAVKRTQRRTEGKEFYQLDEVQNINEIVVTPKERTTTIVFLLSFLLLIVYGIVTKQGTSYALIVMIILSAVVGIVGRMDIDHVVESMAKGMASQAKMFVVFVTIDVLLNLVTLGGGFDAISNLLSGAAGSSPTAVMLIASVVGGFGIEAAAVAEIKIIAGMFGAAAVASGLPMTMFAIAILSATRLTGGIYPTSNMMGQLGIAHSENTREMLEANWIASGSAIIFVVIWALIGPMILT
ncbi:TRAP transporter large permease subunit [Faecalispora anaeroviscerum]|uniref:TRAP transporter large permease subunit n=1 Tax=Faecalispora anaeroviscerum TaxID=2991836 RepID=UPI0024B8D872|nr:TRAP transporter large permease subunit [Faecalispora anaeroviscerum]